MLRFCHEATPLGAYVVLVGAVLAALSIWIVLPDMVVAFNDDFGYLRSVVATIQHGRPWTDDWLEPWSASLSLASGLIYMATGSFSVATYGLQIAMVALSFWAMTTLFARRSMPVPAAMAVTLVVLFSPTLMVKQLEYTALVIYLPLLLLALQFAEKRWWLGFFFVWMIAVTSRQSAVAWLALPGVAATEALLPRPLFSRRRPIAAALVCVCGVAVYIFVARSMNETHAQHVMTSAMWRGLTVAAVSKHLVLAVVVFLASAGCAGFAVRAFCSRQGDSVQWGWSRIGSVAAACVVLGLMILDVRTVVAFDHPFYSGGTGRAYLGLLFALGVAGWLLGNFRLQMGHVLCGACSALLVSLRGATYDYYLIDVALMGVFSVVPSTPAAEQERWRVRDFRSGLAMAGSAACLALACFEFHFAAKEKRILDRYAEVIRLCEPALRAGQIGPSELSVAPFGFYGWHLYPYFVERDGAKGGYIADFEKYLKRDSLLVTFTKIADVRRRQVDQEATDQEGVLTSGIARIGFRGEFLFTLRRTQEAKAASLPMDLQAYRVVPFPLNDAEWRRLIEGNLH